MPRVTKLLALLFLTAAFSSCGALDRIPGAPSAGDAPREALRDGADRVWTGIADLAGADEPGQSGPSSAPGAPEPPGERQVRRELAALEISPPSLGSMSGYSRELFPHWAADGRGFGWPRSDASCDVRDDALIRDGRAVGYDETCAIYEGTWLDPYTGEIFDDPQDIEIDHFVPLANAYRSGASSWPENRREAFANDPNALLSAGAEANAQKSDEGPEAWLPPNEAIHCEYARRWVWIKSVWHLSVTPTEYSALRGLIGRCAAN